MKNLLIAVLVFFSFYTNSAMAEKAHGLSMFGALKYEKDFKHFDYVNPSAPKGGTLRQAVIGTFDNLNPHILKGVSAAGLDLTSDALLTQSADEAFSKYGLIAEYVELASDKKSITFYINEKAKWNDGTPITADDVIFSLETLKTKGHPFYRGYYKDIEKAEKISEGVVKFIFSTSENRELPLIAGQLPLVSKKYYEKNDFTKTSLEPPLSNGPYIIEKVEPGKKLTLKRNENYWAKDLPVNKGRYNFDRIIIDYYLDETVAIEALKAGLYDFRQENVAKNWAKAYNTKELESGLIKKQEIEHQIPTGMQAFAFNTRKEKFADTKVREALTYAFDFEWTNKTLFFSAYTRNRSFFQNSIFASNGLPEGAELELLKDFSDKIPPRVFTEEYNPPVTDGSGFPRENLIKAKEILEKAGWKIKNKKLTNEKTGEEMKIEFLINSPAFERVTAPLLVNLKKLGIDASIRNVDSAQYIKRLEDFDFDITVTVFAQSMSPGNEQIDYWHSSKADVKGSRNLAGIKNPVVDTLVEKIISAKTEEELISATHALDRVLQWNFYVIPNWHVRSFRIVYWDKFGMPETRPKYDLGVDTWWLDETKEKELNKKR